jgi:hypothetical protein
MEPHHFDRVEDFDRVEVAIVGVAILALWVSLYLLGLALAH